MLIDSAIATLFIDGQKTLESVMVIINGKTISENTTTIDDIKDSPIDIGRVIEIEDTPEIFLQTEDDEPE